MRIFGIIASSIQKTVAAVANFFFTSKTGVLYRSVNNGASFNSVYNGGAALNTISYATISSNNSFFIVAFRRKCRFRYNIFSRW